jgi:cell pole-organizing protein PopZ
MSASEEAASALERAIAALRAGHVPTSSPQSESQFMPTLALVPEPEPEPQPEPELELVLTEFEVEMIAEEPVMFEALEAEPEEVQAWESEAPSYEAPSYEAPQKFEIAPEPQAPRVNGSGAHQAYGSAPPSAGTSPLGAKTLEDSVKDMLRPMLRQWLEENMSRVLTAALKDELRDNAGQGQDD